MAATDDEKIVGRNLRRARLSRGLSQEDVARLIGVTEGGYRKWERGDYEPSRRYRKLLEQVLQRPYWWFHEDHGNDDGFENQRIRYRAPARGGTA